MLVNVGAGPGGGFDPDVVLLKEITIRGSFVYGSEFDDAVGLLARGDVRVDDLTTEIVPVGEALRAIDPLRSAEVMKVFVAPNELTPHSDGPRCSGFGHPTDARTAVGARTRPGAARARRLSRHFSHRTEGVAATLQSVWG
ncbi:hypothetical protein ACWGJB_32370 [Streptomyces sp. NPDC054813]